MLLKISRASKNWFDARRCFKYNEYFYFSPIVVFILYALFVVLTLTGICGLIASEGKHYSDWYFIMWGYISLLIGYIITVIERR
jgi:general stress protein CsbA